MKKMFIVLVAWLALGAGAQAQQFFVGGGLQLQFLAGNTLVGLDAQFGSHNALARNVGLRGDLHLLVSPLVDLGLGFDIYGIFPSSTLAPYVGAGASIYVLGGLAFELHALAGLEFRVSRGLGVFVEATPGLYFLDGQNAFLLGLGFGLRAQF